MGGVLRRAAVYLLILAPLITLHLQYVPRNGPFSVDGSYYMQAARSIADENRLTTHVSLGLDGLYPLPAPWDSKPLWPVVLGLAAKALGLFGAANVLPQLFYLLDLMLFGAVAQRMNRRLGEGATWRMGADVIDASHLAVVMFGTSVIFFEATVFPYNEGLAFALALASLLILDRSDEWPLYKWSATAGLLTGLSCLARYQMIALPIACAGVLLLSRRIRGCLIYGLTAAIVVVPWMLYVRGVERYHVQVDALPWEGWVRPASVAAQAWQILRGLAVAFHPFSAYSYWNSFALLVLLVPLALFVRVRLPLLAWMLAATGALSALMLARLEMPGLTPWLFGDRHSLLFGFAIVAALVVCFARGTRTIRALAAVVLVIGVAQNIWAIANWPGPGNGPSVAERKMFAWLNQRAPRATLLTTNPQILSVYVHNSFQWTECGVPPATTRKMIDRLHIDYVIIYGHERTCAFATGIEDRVALAARFDDDVNPIYLFAVTSKMARTGAPSTFQTATGLR